MSPVLAGLWLLGGLAFGGLPWGGLFGSGGDADCRHSAEAGARTMQAIYNEWPLRLSADPVRGYVQRLGDELARSADTTGGDEEWRFFVVRDLEPTAFAVGGRRFVVSDGLIAFVRNESDLAAVLAHEIAHQRLGHFCGNAPRDPQPIRHGSIVQHFDLAIERAADAQAVALLTAAGFDPGSMYEVLRCLAERPGAPVHQLEHRMQALGPPAAIPAAVRRGGADAFPEVRDLVLSEFGEQVQRCR